MVRCVSLPAYSTISSLWRGYFWMMDIHAADILQMTLLLPGFGSNDLRRLLLRFVQGCRLHRSEVIDIMKCGVRQGTKPAVERRDVRANLLGSCWHQ